MITIYTKDFCPYCVMAKNLLSSLDAKYKEVDVGSDIKILQEISKKSWMRTVPQIFVWDEPLGGYSDIADLHKKGELIKKLGI